MVPGEVMGISSHGADFVSFPGLGKLVETFGTHPWVGFAHHLVNI